MTTSLTTDILVVGGGTGGTCAAIQAARHGLNTILVSEFPWLGGMLTSAGVCAPDGNELDACQTGLWGAYVRELHRQTSLNQSWVSMFSYPPQIGANIFANWVKQLPNLHWIESQIPLAVLRKGNRITGVRFTDFLIEAKIVLDGTELGDLLALGNIPHRWGWEFQEEFNEPSAPPTANELTHQYPVQSPTWVVILKDYGETKAPEIPALPTENPEQFFDAWKGYGAEKFLNYGCLPGGLFMINWPQWGNDYGKNLERLIESETSRKQFHQEAQWQSQSFARFIQTHLGRRYGLGSNVFPHDLGFGAFALHPYYRESRRLNGQVTMTEWDILPIAGGQIASLPFDEGQVCSIAIGNYPNDHHYPGIDFPLQPKSMLWGGRYTGTGFTVPYDSLVPINTEGFLVCEKNISVSHIANGSTRLQPVVMNIGQAAGMAAALCVELNCEPVELPVRKLQDALLQASVAPAGVIPLYNLSPDHPDWLYWQQYYLDHPEDYPLDGNCPCQPYMSSQIVSKNQYRGQFIKHASGQYYLTLKSQQKTWQLVTLRPEVHEQFQTLKEGTEIEIWGDYNPAGKWLVVNRISSHS